ncbi:hypothetical protein DPX16_17227 [Anabarilius grahami]|uniref:Uncharacterized protein n=1 Tax=Anabarilius grahami TaxID=495550 RepID=A0A3N0YAZ4_ANAGA|nr:hypothetical protein DPX16_17227 [Anabarilius grahami]
MYRDGTDPSHRLGKDSNKSTVGCSHSWPLNSRRDGVLVQAIVGKGKDAIARSATPLQKTLARLPEITSVLIFLSVLL